LKNLFNSRKITTFAVSNQKQMKRYKVREVIRMLEEDGWRIKRTRGSHRQFVHPVKKGKVTVNKKLSEELDQFELNSIWKQAVWR